MNPSGPYRVHYTGRIRDRVRLLLTRAIAARIASRASAALQHIEVQLLTDPTGWGDHIYRLHTIGVDVYERVHDGIYVVYSVKEDERRVWLTRLYPIIGHPLHDPNEPPHG
jgi:hypothetical protein